MQMLTNDFRTVAAIEWTSDGQERSHLWEFFIPHKGDIVVFEGVSLKVSEIVHLCIGDSLTTYIKCELHNA